MGTNDVRNELYGLLGNMDFKKLIEWCHEGIEKIRASESTDELATRDEHGQWSLSNAALITNLENLANLRISLL